MSCWVSEIGWISHQLSLMAVQLSQAKPKDKMVLLTVLYSIIIVTPSPPKKRKNNGTKSKAGLCSVVQSHEFQRCSHFNLVKVV